MKSEKSKEEEKNQLVEEAMNQDLLRERRKSFIDYLQDEYHMTVKEFVDGIIAEVEARLTIKKYFERRG